MESLLIGIKSIELGNIVMLVIAGILIYLAIVKEYEPVLLLPIGFGAIMANIPLVFETEGMNPLIALYEVGIK
ncbi:MAG: sodium ion-translocating decarboxylase subunit beta, partial [Clostridiaceae bacterium]|nr:sodium ion-translocating decarboxylase subunit beta [Clostridiaceae bacterium]